MNQPGSHTLIRGNQPAADRMREPLARTVQDQFTDQRSNAGALEDIRQRPGGRPEVRPEVRIQERAELRPVPAPRDGAGV